MDSNFVQMIISLNGSRDVIPEEISVLTDSHAKDALPRQLSHPRKEVKLLSHKQPEGDE